MIHMRNVMMLLIACFMVACSASDVWTPAAQQWGKFNVHIETRPEVLDKGMNEFMVMVERDKKRYTPDLMVDIRTSSSDWRQAMPDGALGIYRRALMVRDLKHEKLYVRMVYHKQKTELVFDLFPQDTAAK